TNLQVVPLVDLLVTDETNPRSIGFQLAALAEHVERLPRQQSDPLLSTEQRLTIALLSSVRLADVNALGEVGPQGTRTALDHLLADSGKHLNELASAVSHKYLVHAGPSYQMAAIHRS
ncbi:MAG TPA: alpha-E domain-containing protein, partial [Pirellulales bacterium]|nr:alpha-E domain-containing protein [Pirellulales bacterium]